MLATVPSDIAQVSYSLGTMKIETDTYGTVLMHGRLINGYAATVRHLPAQHLSVAATANRSNADVDSIAAAILAVVWATP